MREIKFRGKHIETGEWVHGNLIGNDVIVGEVVEWDSDYFCTEFWMKVDPKTVGQYTGLKDHNGEDIYEGDILDCTSELVTYFGNTRTGMMSTTYYQVLWRKEGWAKKVLQSKSLVVGSVTDGIEISLKYSEVIGNIYQYKNLLEANHE